MKPPAPLLALLALLAVPLGSDPATAETRQPSYTSPPPTGWSVDGRPIRVVVRGNPSSPRRILVFGCIHGTECAGIPIAKQLTRATPPSGTALWIVENLVPDGFANGTRWNARGVNLNRNFPWKWERIGPRGGQDYAGTRALSEPEAAFAAALIRQVKPKITIWYHQHMNLVDLSGGSALIQRRYGCLTRMRVRQLLRYRGSVSTWQNNTFPGSTAFVVELPPGTLPPAAVRRHQQSVIRLASQGSPPGCP